MKQRILFFFKYYIFWLVLMQCQKLLFMCTQYARMGDVSALDWLRVLVHAFPLDLTVASYVTAVFGLLLVASFFVPAWLTARLGAVYTVLMMLLVTVIIGTDIAVFPAWGFHPDKTVFIYLSSPEEVLACAPWYIWVLGVSAMLAACAAGCAACRWWMRGVEKMTSPDGWRKPGGAAAMLLMTALLFLPARGSVTTSTMNTGRVYFSDNQMLNQAAVNPVFNLFESMSEYAFDSRRYTYMPSSEAQDLVAEMLPVQSGEGYEQLLACSRPDIVLCILESFSKNAWEAMPNLRRMASEGVYFSNAVASSFRTDRGVVAVMSAFPGQPTSSLMIAPNKSRNLPQIGRTLAQEGYRLKFWYGGDEDFTNMRSYLVRNGFLDRVSDHSFPIEHRLSKWGVPDHILFSRAAEEIAHRTDSVPRLDVILSLSSHEPFEVPMHSRFADPYLNSVAYADSCLGAFVDSLRCSPAWDNTLVVMVADHGYPYPSQVQNHEPRRYAIPVVWTGGVIREHRDVPVLCSQTDLVPTLLAQMGIDRSEYVFGKDVLDTAAVPFAFYSFIDGFALLTPQDTVVVDARADRRIIGDDAQTERHARAFMQSVMEAVDRL